MKWQFIRDETLKLVMKHLLKGEYVLYRGRHGRLIEVVEMSGLRMMQNSHSGPFNLIDVGNGNE